MAPPRVLIAFAALMVSGCVGPELPRSITYGFADHHRLAAERRATQQMQDSCYFSGYQYFRPEGPPQIVSQGDGADRRFQATQLFDCVGTVGGP